MKKNFIVLRASDEEKQMLVDLATKYKTSMSEVIVSSITLFDMVMKHMEDKQVFSVKIVLDLIKRCLDQKGDKND